MFDPMKNVYLSQFSLEPQCIFLHILTDLCAAKIADEISQRQRPENEFKGEIQSLQSHNYTYLQKIPQQKEKLHFSCNVVKNGGKSRTRRRIAIREYIKVVTKTSPAFWKDVRFESGIKFVWERIISNRSSRTEMFTLSLLHCDKG